MSNIELINQYYPDAVIRNFTDLDEKLKDYYDYIADYDPEPKEKLTPRSTSGDFRSTSRDIFYYISWLYDNNPKSVLDFGCGQSQWKKWFPNIFRVDVKDWAYTDIDLVVEIHKIYEFIEHRKQQFDCGMAINSIHFGNFENVIDNIHKCMSLVKPKGRFLFTINMKMILSYSKIIDTAHNTPISDVYFSKLVDMIKSTEYKILLLDIVMQANPGINGDIRFILERN